MNELSEFEVGISLIAARDLTEYDLYHSLAGDDRAEKFKKFQDFRLKVRILETTVDTSTFQKMQATANERLEALAKAVDDVGDSIA